MLLIERTYTEAPPDGNEVNAIRGKFARFESAHGLIVLGDPGMGKTMSFKSHAANEENAVYIKAVEFYNQPKSLLEKNYQGKVLYIDGLDEIRSRTQGNVNPIDHIRNQIAELNIPRFRLSCRSLEWGTGDLSVLCNTLKVPVRIIRIDHLTDDQIEAIIEHDFSQPDAFLKEAKAKDFYSLLKNPHNLELFIKIYKSGQTVENRLELFEKAADILISEINEEHAKGAVNKYTAEDLLFAAGKMCTVHLLSNAAGLALSKATSEKHTPYILDAFENKDLANFAIRTRVFIADGKDSVIPCHRTIAEFIAAKYLVKRLRQGFPLGRVLSWITGADGGTLPDLRGLYAWITTLYPEQGDHLIQNDPIGILRYGDISIFSPSLKRQMLKTFKTLSEKNPWFIGETRSNDESGKLIGPDTEMDIQKILRSESSESTYLTFILEALEVGPPAPSLAKDLLKIIKDKSTNEHQKEMAASAYIKADPAGQNELIKILDNINSGKIKDATFQLRGNILHQLYPKYLTAKNILKYIRSDEDSNFIGRYQMFIRHELVQWTPKDQLTDLADALSKHADEETKEYLQKNISGELILSLLESHGETADGKTIYEWLGCLIDEHHMSVARNERELGKKFDDYYTNHPRVFKKTFEYWSRNVHNTADKSSLQEYYFDARINCSATSYPKDFGVWLLSQAENESDEGLKRYFFIKSLILICYQQTQPGPSYEEYWELAKKVPGLEAVLKENSSTRLSERHLEFKLDDKVRKLEREQKHQDMLEDFRKNIDHVRSGKPWEFLSDMVIRLRNHQKSTSVKISIELEDSFLPDELHEAALKGFKAIPHRKDILTPKQVARLQVKNQTYRFIYPFMCGCKILYLENKNWFESVPDAAIELALGAHYFSQADLFDNDEWYYELIAARPKIFKSVIGQMTDILFAANIEHVSGLYSFCTDEHLKPYALELIPKLLKKYPKPRYNALSQLLYFYLRNHEWKKIDAIAENILKEAKDSQSKQLWFAAAFIANPEKYFGRYSKYVVKSINRIWSLIEVLSPNWMSKDPTDLFKNLPLKTVEQIIKLIGKHFPRESDIRSGWRGSREPRTADETFAKALGVLGSNISIETNRTLKRLSQERVLAGRQARILNILNEHTQKLRQAQHEYLPPEKILQAIDGGKPSTQSDLKAFIKDHLEALAKEYKGSPTNPFMKFWSGKPHQSFAEEDCRDRLTEDLQTRLKPLGIHAEPEGTHAGKKSSDIKVIASSSLILPVEIKKNKNKEIWSGINEQLISQYTTDPATGGYGLYLALWFSAEEQAAPPKKLGIPKPQTPEELKVALTRLLPINNQHLLDVIIVDLSLPKTSKQKRGKQQKKRRGLKKGSTRKR